MKRIEDILPKKGMTVDLSMFSGMVTAIGGVSGFGIGGTLFDVVGAVIGVGALAAGVFVSWGYVKSNEKRARDIAILR
jgi:hypothetical protein